jgi:hypothetical protein
MAGRGGRWPAKRAQHGTGGHGILEGKTQRVMMDDARHAARGLHLGKCTKVNKVPLAPGMC